MLQMLVKVEPLTAQVGTSVPPLSMGLGEAEGLAVPPSKLWNSPEVLDAASMAASVVAWTGDPPLLSGDFYEVLQVDFDRDLHPEFEDKEYAKLPREGPLHTMYHSKLLPSPVPADTQPLADPPARPSRHRLVKLTPWGGGVFWVRSSHSRPSHWIHGFARKARPRD